MEPILLQNEKQLQRYFFWSVLLKGAISVVEIIAGFLVLFVPPAMLASFLIDWAQQELLEEPGSFVAGHALPLLQHASAASSGVIAFYLLSRGIIKLGLVVALLKDRLWAYPASLAVLGLFMIYQLYDIVVAHSTLMILITLFDAIVVYLIWREYTVVRRNRHIGR